MDTGRGGAHIGPGGGFWHRSGCDFPFGSAYSDANADPGDGDDPHPNAIADAYNSAWCANRAATTHGAASTSTVRTGYYRLARRVLH